MVIYDEFGPEKILEVHDDTETKTKRDNEGKFVKGVTPWNKGKKRVYSKQTLERMSNAKKGKHISQRTEFKRGNISWCKGLKGLHIKGSEKGWFKKGRVLSEKINEKSLKKLREIILINTILVVNENLGYIIGVILGDGSVYRINRSCRISFEVTSQDFAINFLNSLREIGLNPMICKIRPTNGISKQSRYRVQANSLVFGNWFNSIKHEIKLAQMLSTYGSKIGFLRGFYESEGTLYIRKKYETPYISICNTNIELLKLVKDLSMKLSIRFNLYGPYINNGSLSDNAKPIYRISTTTIIDGYKFLSTVKPNIKNGVGQDSIL